MRLTGRRWLGYASITAVAFLTVVLLVPLTLSRWLREALFVRLYTLIMYFMADDLVPVRKQVMSYMDAMDSHDDCLRKEGLLRVLEIGAGYGANLPYIRRKIKYSNVDPNKEFDTLLMQELAKYKGVHLEDSICGHGEDMHSLPDGHFDAVVMTFVLCSADDGHKLLQEVKRVLTKSREKNTRFLVAYPSTISYTSKVLQERRVATTLERSTP
ncbi:hypothetical protein V5799_013026 [Amblyomma americanum]|uniref:Methyltransferase type 11 domain-containing protein n=1 Tax=Amblyomma americanum TaxID=6943 RepID=A0AAQ4E7A2_AMBAM